MSWSPCLASNTWPDFLADDISSCSLSLVPEGGGEGGMGRELMGPRVWLILLTLARVPEGLLGGGEARQGDRGRLQSGEIGRRESGARGGFSLHRGGVGSSCQEEREEEGILARGRG